MVTIGLHPRRSRLAALVAALLSAYAGRSIAATTTYTSVWAGGTIAPSDTVVLNNGASVTGNVVNNGTLQFNSILQSGYVYEVNKTISGTGTLSLTNNGTLVLSGATVDPSTVVLDMTTSVSAGSLEVLSGTGTLRVGNNGTGALNVIGGSVRIRDGYLGYNAGSVGVATVSSGEWISNYLYFGKTGTATLNVTGGSVRDNRSFFGYDASGAGTATVTSGTLLVNSNLVIGDYGTGTLSLIGGSVVTNNSNLFLGLNGGVGRATVSGGTFVGSGFGSLYLGEFGGTGSLDVIGGSVSIGTIVFGFNSGTGTLNVSGGLVASTNSYLGYGGNGSVGTATVSSGTWANVGDLFVGSRSTSTLNVTGGMVSNSTCYLGHYAGYDGTATVSSGTWANNGDLTIGSSGTGTLTMSGGVVTVGGVLSTGSYGTINLNAGGTLQIGTGDTTGILGVSALTNNGTLIFNRSDASTYSGVISGSGAVTKQGTGQLTLSGSSAYTGATTVSGGQLSVNGALGNSPVAVLAAAEIGGSGRIGGTVNVADGGTLSPGNSIESLVTGAVTFAAGATFEYEVDSSRIGSLGTAADLLVVNGDLDLASGTLLTIVDLASSVSAFVENTTIFAMINYSGSWNGGFFTYGTNVLSDGERFMVGNQQWQIDYSRTSSVGIANFTGDYLPSSRFVSLMAVPEPSTYAMVFSGLACGGGLMWRRRKRVRKAA